MRGIQIGVLVFGLGLAGFGVYMAQNYVDQTEAALAAAQSQPRVQAAPTIETTQVFVASRPIRYGEPISVTDVRPVEWPATAVPPGAYTELNALVPDPSRPRVALRAMEPNEPLLRVKLSDPGQTAGIAAMLQPGLRAFTIRVDASSGISGTLRPSDTVDIYWSGRGAEGDITRLLSSSVQIIALDENADQDRTFNGIPRSVTVQATPETIATLAQAQSTGRLSLSLVGLDDQTTLSQFQIDQNNILGVERRAQPVVQERCTVRTRRGNEVVMIEIPCTN